MDAGSFDRRVTLQRATETDDGFSTVETSWTDIATVWAQILPFARPAMERSSAGEFASSAYVIFKIRRDSAWDDLNAKDRLIYNDKPHNITFVREDERMYFILDTVVRGDS
jgi:SPP1 family predicted phage head-tail adaptor